MNINLHNKIKIVPEKKARALLPNILTIIGVCIGLSSIKFALDAKFELSIIAITFAAIIDGLDGRVARLIKATSKVGKELDSLTDVISFGVAPAFIMYFWHANQMGKLGWFLSLTYVVCVALRLARFNISSNQNSSWKDNFFEGVPSPAGAMLLLLPLILDRSDFYSIDIYKSQIVSAMFIIIPLLMVSKIPTYALKKIVIPRKATRLLLFGIAIYFGLLIIFTFQVLFISGAIYILLIPISAFHYKKIFNKYKNSDYIEDEDEDEDEEDML